MESKTRNKLWLKNPLTDEEFPGRENTEVRKVSLRIKTLLVLVFSLTTVALVCCILSVRVYKKMSVNEHMQLANGTSNLTAGAIDGDRVSLRLQAAAGRL